MWSHLVDDVEFGLLYSDALKDSRRSIEEIVPFKLLWKARKDPINSFHQFWRNDNRHTKSISNSPQIQYFHFRTVLPFCATYCATYLCLTRGLGHNIFWDKKKPHKDPSCNLTQLDPTKVDQIGLCPSLDVVFGDTCHLNFDKKYKEPLKSHFSIDITGRLGNFEAGLFHGVGCDTWAEVLMANMNFSFTLDSCYMRSMTDVCSMFENWTRADSAQRGGLKIGFTLGRGWNSPTQRAVANVIGLGLELVMNGALFYALVGNVIDVINFRYVMHDKYINAEQKFYVW